MKLLALTLATLGLATANLKCSPGEVVDSSGICIQPKYIEGCYQYASQYTCNKCQYKYKLNQYGLCEYQRESGEACCLQKKKGVCVKCNYGLKLHEDGSCRQNSLVGCLEKSQEGNCVNCSSEYYLESGKCIQGIKECLAYDSQKMGQVCIECKKNYSLVNNACLKNRILGCEFQMNHKCMKCTQPFINKKDHCQIPFCSTYNDFGCTACECGYFLNPKNVCEEIQAGCIRYQRGVCMDCQPHFKLRGGTCVMEGCQKLQFLTCSKCSEGYTLAEGSCKLNNCTNWDNGNCLVCDDGYVTQGGKCMKQLRQLTFESASS